MPASRNLHIQYRLEDQASGLDSLASLYFQHKLGLVQVTHRASGLEPRACVYHLVTDRDTSLYANDPVDTKQGIAVMQCVTSDWSTLDFGRLE